MPPETPTGFVKKDTIKKAKAAFKSRGFCPLTVLEQRQLDRAVELDRRARWIKTGEKRKIAAIKERQEGERRRREEIRKAVVDTGRQCDQFGFKSSQMHLGAYFCGLKYKKHESRLAVVTNKIEDQNKDVFDGVDDQTMLDALSNTAIPRISPAEPSGARAEPSRRLPLLQKVDRQSLSPPTKVDDLEDLWEELGTGTQIARELNEQEVKPQHTKVLLATSFSSEDFDIFVEDIELPEIEQNPKPKLPSHLQPFPGPPLLKLHSSPPARPPECLPNREIADLSFQKVRTQAPTTSTESFLPDVIEHGDITMSQLDQCLEIEFQLGQSGSH